MAPSERTKPPEKRLRQLGSWTVEFAEPIIAAVAGLALAIAGLTGEITGDELTAATLLVLSVVAVSLVRERSLRVRANHNIVGLGVQLDETRDAVNAIGSGNPYSVLCHDTTWDIAESDGNLVYATRVKKIRIDQNNVVSLYDFAEGDGEREIEYTPGKAVTNFIGEGRLCSLIALGRVYYRGERLDFATKRTVRGGFTSAHESVSVLTRDATELMRLKIQWPADKPPTAVRLGRATPAQEWRNENVLDKVKKNGGRPTYQVEIHSPEKGGSTTIEWEWEPAPAKAAGDN